MARITELERAATQVAAMQKEVVLLQSELRTLGVSEAEAGGGGGVDRLARSGGEDAGPRKKPRRTSRK